MKTRITEICQALEEKSLEWYRTSETAQEYYSSEEDYILKIINNQDFARQRRVVAHIIQLAERKGASSKIKAIVFQSIQDGLFDVWYDVLEQVNSDCEALELPFSINDQYQPVSTKVEKKNERNCNSI